MVTSPSSAIAHQTPEVNRARFFLLKNEGMRFIKKRKKKKKKEEKEKNHY